MSRKLLVYLYPREWRVRYGEGFKQLLDVTPLTLGVIFNVVLAAGRQRMMHTMLGAVLCGLTVTYAAWHTGQYLNSLLTVEPMERIPVGSAGAMLFVPSWPVFLVLLAGALIIAAFHRSGIWTSRPATLIGEREFVVWLAALFFVSSLFQWAQLASEPVIEVWKDAAIHGTLTLFVLKMRHTPIAPQQTSRG